MLRRLSSYTRLLNHPWRILVIVLAVVFCVETLVMLALPYVLGGVTDHRVRAILDAAMLTLICAPVLWWIIIGPLRRIAMIEQTRSNTIAANAGDGILTVDRFGNILSFNRAACRLFQSSGEEVIGQSVENILPGLVLAETDPNAPLQTNGLRRDGMVFPAALSIRALPDDVDDAFVVILRDLTEAERAEQLRLTSAREKEAMRAQQMATLAQLATGVAHEIRNPLTSVKMLVQANRAQLQESGLPSEDLELVESEIRRIESSVNALLDYARPSPAARRTIDLVETLKRTRSLVEGRADSQNVAIEITGASGIRVSADPEQLHQLFLNLSLNALDAMPSGGTLKFCIDQCDGVVTVETTDTGSGIDPRVLEKLFTPFVTTKKHGVGLGLGICRRIAEDQGGSLTGGNTVDGGARFVLSLPSLTNKLSGDLSVEVA